MVNTLRFWATWSLATLQLCHCCVKAALDDMQMNGCGYVSIIIYWMLNLELYEYNAHRSQTILFLLIYFQLRVKMILSSQAVQK